VRDKGKKKARSASLVVAAALSTATTGQAPIAGSPGHRAYGAPKDVVDRFAGTYRFVGGERERKAWEEAIEDVVVEMNLIVRGMARKRIRETNRIADEIAVERRDNQLSLRLDDHNYTAPIDGPSHGKVSGGGDGVKILHNVEHGQIQQTFLGEDGGRVNTFSMGKDGRMRVRVRVFSDRLPRDLRYQLTYEK
jgi:hypothetical protein